MKIKLFPSLITGSVKAPSSKSVTHRAIILASFSHQTIILENVDLCEDIIETIKICKLLGVKFIYDYDKKTLKIISPLKFNHCQNFFCKESGSTLRLLVPLLCVLFDEITFECSPRLIERIKKTENSNFLYQYNNNHIKIKKNFSTPIPCSPTNTTQYLSGFLILNFFYPEYKLKFFSKNFSPYLLLTIEIIDKFKKIIFCKNHSRKFFVEGDYSNSAPLLIMGALNGEITLQNLLLSSKQGDTKIISFLKSCSCNITQEKNNVHVSTSILKNFEIDISKIPDLGPLLIGLAAVTPGKNIITGFTPLIYKESNRLEETIKILTFLKVDIKQEDDKLIINGKKNLVNPLEIKIAPDHRLIMMICAISSRFRNPLIINNVEAINKSYPQFFKDLKKLGFHFEEIYD